MIQDHLDVQPDHVKGQQVRSHFGAPHHLGQPLRVAALAYRDGRGSGVEEPLLPLLRAHVLGGRGARPVPLLRWRALGPVLALALLLLVRARAGVLEGEQRIEYPAARPPPSCGGPLKVKDQGNP